MKKLYISCPTKGRKWDDITKTFDKMHKLAEILFDQELEVINTDLGNLEATDMATLAEHISAMSEADYFVGLDELNWGREGHWRMCRVECETAMVYGLDSKFVHMDDVAPDCREVIARYYDELRVKEVENQQIKLEV
jgi:hypothetical protein